jgi:hypothetical protein
VGAIVAPVPVTSSPGSVGTYAYHATPSTPNQTGVRGFGGEASGRICFTTDGTPVPGAAGQLDPTCTDLR